MAEGDAYLEKIAVDGDIILVVGSPLSKRLLVSSATLRRTSKVFEALLSSRWQGDQDIFTADNPKEIELPEDQADAILDMCNLLHGHRAANNAKVETTMQIFELSIVVDKYGCAEALHYQSQALLLMTLDGVQYCPISALFRIATASYLLNQLRAFRIATRALIWMTWSDYTVGLQAECAKFLPMVVFLALQKKRSAAYEKIYADLPLLGMPTCHEFIHDDLHGSESANYDAGYMDQLCNTFEIPFWPPNFYKMDYSVADAVEKIQLMGVGRLKYPTCEHTWFEEGGRHAGTQKFHRRAGGHV